MLAPEIVSEIAEFESNWRFARTIVELAAVTAGTLSGTLHAIKRDYDLVGVVAIGLATGLGGGIARDLMIGQGPVLALRHSSLLVTAFVAAVVGIVLEHRTHRIRFLLWLVDALSLGLFTVAGIQRAEEVGLRVVPALFLGVVTGTGGGLIRDVLCRETPALLVPGLPYAPAALLGGLTYYGVRLGLDWPRVVGEWLAMFAAFAVRAVATWRRWIVPKPAELMRPFRRRRGKNRRTPSS